MLFSCRFSFANSRLLRLARSSLFCNAQTITIGKRKRLPLQTHDVWNWLCVFRIAFRLYAIIFVRILQNKKRGNVLCVICEPIFCVCKVFSPSFSLQKWRAEKMLTNTRGDRGRPSKRASEEERERRWQRVQNGESLQRQTNWTV